MKFERSGNAKKALNIGSLTKKIGELIITVKGAIIPYNDFITFNIKPYTDKHTICIVLKDSQYIMLAGKYSDETYQTGPLKDLVFILEEEASNMEPTFGPNDRYRSGKTW